MGTTESPTLAAALLWALNGRTELVDNNRYSQEKTRDNSPIETKMS